MKCDLTLTKHNIAFGIPVGCRSHGTVPTLLGRAAALTPTRRAVRRLLDESWYEVTCPLPWGEVTHIPCGSGEGIDLKQSNTSSGASRHLLLKGEGFHAART